MFSAWSLMKTGNPVSRNTLYWPEMPARVDNPEGALGVFSTWRICSREQKRK